MCLLPASNGKISDAEADKIIQDFESKIPQALFDKLNAQVAEANKATRQNMFKYGRISKEQLDELEARYQNYVPLKGWEESDDDPMQNYVDSGYGNRGANSLLKQAKGRKSIADHPLSNMMFDAQISMVRKRVVTPGKTAISTC